MKKQWKQLAALSSAAVIAAGTLLYFPTDTLQNISWGITASAEETGAGTESGSQIWNEDDGLTWTLDADGTLTISGTGAMKDIPAYNNSNIKKVVIQNGVTSIGNGSFGYCSSLTDITIPGSVTSIGVSAFAGCTDLTSITIPEGVTNIRDYAFIDCIGLTSITIPKSVTSIGSNVFDGCTALTEVLLENGSTLTSDNLGVDASKIATYWNEDNLTWTLTADGTLTISGEGTMKDYNSADNSPACDNSNITKVVIEDGVTSIGNNAFSVCTGLTSITIPESVTSIGNDAFSWCISLTGITIPKSVTSIGSNVFDGCTALTAVLLESGSTLTSEQLGVDADKISSYQSWQKAT